MRLTPYPMQSLSLLLNPLPKQEKVISHLQAYGYNLKDADRNSPVNSKTNNLFAWHPQGPLKESIIQKVLHK